MDSPYEAPRKISEFEVNERVRRRVNMPDGTLLILLDNEMNFD